MENSNGRGNTSLGDEPNLDIGDSTSWKTPIDYKWVFKMKRQADESVECYKARLVAKGFTQRRGSLPLRKSLYGLRQASRNWHSKFADALRGYAFLQSDLICDLISFFSSINGEVLLLRSHCSHLRAPRIVRRSALDLALPCSQARHRLHSHHLPFEARRFAGSRSCQCASRLNLILAVVASLGCGSRLFPLPSFSISVLTCSSKRVNRINKSC
ncbi:hypothetical protein CRG98_036810 [Punica granatum]|uniref:Reverse transcriptase Ty1/copia-type domain-containing protein n=1 Tax=Punica granatum TaxID=22663 RepID=A0A2I0IFM1_PUNGR|nr:hypothetical protein CRG98_036810 [Punica granatum]